MYFVGHLYDLDSGIFLTVSLSQVSSTGRRLFEERPLRNWLQISMSTTVDASSITGTLLCTKFQR